MIAKFISSLILITGLSSVLSQSISTKDFHYYVQVAHDFDIHPPELTCGYPWWYDADTLPVTGIIFLKENLDNPIEKLNDTAWVVEPTEKNAKEIAAFSELKSHPVKYMIVPDSNLTIGQIEYFYFSLIGKIENAKFLYWGKNGNYALQTYLHLQPREEMQWVCGDGWIYDNLSIAVNSEFKFLVEGRLTLFDSVKNSVSHGYSANFDHETDPRQWEYKKLTAFWVQEKLEDYKKMLSHETNLFLENEILLLEKQLVLIKRHGDLTIPSKHAKISLDIYGKNTLSVSQLFSIFSEVNKGLLEARSEICLTPSYIELYGLRHFSKLEFIHAQMPDLLIDYEDNRYIEKPKVINL